MATFGLNLTGLSSGNPLPGTYIEVQFGAGSASGDLSAKRALLLAPSLASGTIVQDTEVYGPISSEDEAIQKGGAGSPLHRMARAWLAVNKSAQLYLCAPTRSAGIQALLAVTVAGTTAGAPGVARIEICEETCDATILVGDTPTIVAAALRDAINAKTYLPVSATAALGVLTITAKAAGPEGNAIRVMPGLVGALGLTISPTVDTPLATGATAASYTAALTTLLARDFDLIVPHTHSGTGADAVLSALATQVASQALPQSGIRQRVLAGTALSAATSVQLAGTINKPRVDIVNLKESRLEPSVLGAIAGATFANTHLENPASNLDFYGTGPNDVFPVLAPRNAGAALTPNEQILMLNGGVTPIAIAPTGAPYIVRQITSYSQNAGAPDYRVRDSHRVSVADRFADDLGAKLRSVGYKWLCDDPPPGSDDQPPAGFATPLRLRVIAEQLITNYCARGWLDPAKEAVMIAGLAVGIDPLVNTRANLRIPIFAVNLLHQTNSLVAESSAAA